MSKVLAPEVEEDMSRPEPISLVLAEARLHQFRRASRTDLDHAPGAGGTATLDFRAQIPACPQLLHVVAWA